MKKEILDLISGTFDEENKRIYFWKGCFSQWHKSPIYDPVMNAHGNCAEQLMMAWKAFQFKDKEAQDAIMVAETSRKQKEIGRTVRGYDDAIWSAKRLQIVADINYYKFNQNPALKEVLLETKDYELVEASPEDRIWGVGLGEKDPLIKDKANWLGQNLLGQAIMIARERILAEQ